MSIKKQKDFLDNAEKEIIKAMEEEERIEKTVDALTDIVYEKLLSKDKCFEYVNEKRFMFKSVKNDKFVVIAAIDYNKFKILGEKYKPFFIKAKIEDGYTLEETLYASVKAFIGKQYGIIKAEELK